MFNWPVDRWVALKRLTQPTLFLAPASFHNRWNALQSNLAVCKSQNMRLGSNSTIMKSQPPLYRSLGRS